MVCLRIGTECEVSQVSIAKIRFGSDSVNATRVFIFSGIHHERWKDGYHDGI